MSQNDIPLHASNGGCFFYAGLGFFFVCLGASILLNVYQRAPVPEPAAFQQSGWCLPENP